MSLDVFVKAILVKEPLGTDGTFVSEVWRLHLDVVDLPQVYVEARLVLVAGAAELTAILLSPLVLLLVFLQLHLGAEAASAYGAVHKLGWVRVLRALALVATTGPAVLKFLFAELALGRLF